MLYWFRCEFLVFFAGIISILHGAWTRHGNVWNALRGTRRKISTMPIAAVCKSVEPNSVIIGLESRFRNCYRVCNSLNSIGNFLQFWSFLPNVRLLQCLSACNETLSKRSLWTSHDQYQPPPLDTVSSKSHLRLLLGFLVSITELGASLRSDPIVLGSPGNNYGTSEWLH